MANNSSSNSRSINEAIRILPDEAFLNLQYLVPQAGCPNACSFCSRTASPTTLNMRPESLKLVYEAIQNEASKRNIIIGSGRFHKPGVVYAHYDNDPLSYPHWDTYVELIAKMGLKIRVSSVGFSAKNREICRKNELVAEQYYSSFHGMRFSVTPYAVSLRKILAGNNVREAEIREAIDRYVADLSNSIKTYRNVQNHIGFGRDRFCIAVRHAPRIENKLPFHVEEYNEYTLIRVGNYIFGVFSEDFKDLTPASVGYMDGRKGILENDGAPCVLVLANAISEANNLIKNSLDQNVLHKDNFSERSFDFVDSSALLRTGRLHIFRNEDGLYYSIDPFGQVPHRFDSINIYVDAQRASCSILDSTRYGYEIMANYRKLEDKEDSLYESYLRELNALAEAYRAIEPKITDYLFGRYIPATEIVMRSFSLAGIDAGAVFGEGAFFHAGHIHNVGRANRFFKGIATSSKISATPVEYKIENPDASVSVDRGMRWIIKPSKPNVLSIAELDSSSLELSTNSINIELKDPICDVVRFRSAVERGYAIGI